jgi:hypothetical protein
MKRTLIIVLALWGSAGYSQVEPKFRIIDPGQPNPFASIGEYEPFKGFPGYEEVYKENATLELYGFVYDPVTGKIVQMKPDSVSDNIVACNDTVRMKPTTTHRWLSTDPVMHPYESPYSAMGNSPIQYYDPDGRDIKPAREIDRYKMRDVINSFDTRKINGADLFGVQQLPKTSVNRTESHGVIHSTLSQAEFNTKLRSSGLSRSDKKEAQALYKLLSSDDIIEIGTVDPNTTTSFSDNDNGRKNAPQGNVGFTESLVNTNPLAVTLLQSADKGDQSTESIQRNLLNQPVSGATTEGGAYAYFPQPANQTFTTDESGTPLRKYSGIILVNPPAASAAQFGGSGNSKAKETKAIREAIQGTVEKQNR